MSVATTRSVMDRYFSAMGAEEDFSQFYDEKVSWSMVDSGQEVRGPRPVHDYVLELHRRMSGGDQRALVVTESQAFLEGSRVNAAHATDPGLAYCLVYDVSDDRITAMRCYGTIAALMAVQDPGSPSAS